MHLDLPEKARKAFRWARSVPVFCHPKQADGEDELRAKAEVFFLGTRTTPFFPRVLHGALTAKGRAARQSASGVEIKCVGRALPTRQLYRRALFDAQSRAAENAHWLNATACQRPHSSTHGFELRRLTFEVSGSQRRDRKRRSAPMRPAGGCPLD